METTYHVVHKGRTRTFEILNDAINFAANLWNNTGGDLVRVIDGQGNVIEEFEG